MKRLINYIKESAISESEQKSKVISFDFSDIDNHDEIVKSLETYDNVECDGSIIKVTVNKNNYDKLDSVQDILQQTIQKERNSSKATNNEEYAQKIVKLEKQLAKFSDLIDMYDDNDNDE